MSNPAPPYPLIGIVGGMGPYAGLDLFEKILDHTRASTDQEHAPVLLASMPHRIPDRSRFLNGETDLNPAEPMTDILRTLDTGGATVAGVPCVTAHTPRIFDVVRQNLRDLELKIRLLSIVEETIRFIRHTYPDVRAVGAISTTATFQNRLFLDPLAEAGFEVIEQDMDVQDRLVNESIFNRTFGIKAHSNPVTDQARTNLTDAVAHLKDRGAQAVILGCTELPLALPETHISEVILVDPTLALARALIHASYPERLAPLPQPALAEPWST